MGKQPRAWYCQSVNCVRKKQNNDIKSHQQTILYWKIKNCEQGIKKKKKNWENATHSMLTKHNTITFEYL